jgi:histidine decarboxylase
VPTDPPTVDPRIAARVAQLTSQLAQVTPATLGFPGAHDLDWTPLAGLFSRGLVNNVGDPDVAGTHPVHAKDFERDVLDMVADLFRASADDRWGYITGGATEGTLCALYLARRTHPDAVVYHSTAAHSSVAKAIDVLGIPSVVVRADRHGELDYRDLAGQVGRRRHRPVIVVATAGTTMTEAVDDVRHIVDLLNRLAIPTWRRFILADAALAGIPLAMLDPTTRPGFDFADGADAVVTSGHKFLGTPMPCAVLVVRASAVARATTTPAYTAAPDTTIATSRNGHAAVALWYALAQLGRDGLAARAEASRQLAAYTHQRLLRLGWPTGRRPHALTVTLATPPPEVAARWALPDQDGRSHIVCVPGVTHAHIDAFLDDLAAHIAPPAATDAPGAHQPRPERDGRRVRVPRQTRRGIDAPTTTAGGSSR